MRPSILIPLFIALAAIWGGVAVVMRATDPYIITPEKVVLLVKDPPWKKGKKPGKEERKAYLEKVAASWNKLDFEQQRQMRDDGKNETEDFFLDLTDEERRWFIAQTVEKQFLMVMKKFQAMSLPDRQKALAQSRTEMRKSERGAESEEGLLQENATAFEIMAEQGMENYYKQGNDKRKLQLAPLLSEMQRRLQGGRRK